MSVRSHGINIVIFSRICHAVPLRMIFSRWILLEDCKFRKETSFGWLDHDHMCSLHLQNSQNTHRPDKKKNKKKQNIILSIRFLHWEFSEVNANAYYHIFPFHFISWIILFIRFIFIFVFDFESPLQVTMQQCLDAM